jgi:hypothetical protein
MPRAKTRECKLHGSHPFSGKTDAHWYVVPSRPDRPICKLAEDARQRLRAEKRRAAKAIAAKPAAKTTAAKKSAARKPVAKA